MMKVETIEIVNLLKELIRIPSFSGKEDQTANCISSFLQQKGVTTHRYLNNVWSINNNYHPNLPTLLINSHHDTVQPNKGYTNNPFESFEEEGKLFGLGSNDAGGCLVSLLASFLHFYELPLKYNLVFLASAEEENSGPNGIKAVLKKLPEIDFALVGEPTSLEMAIGEKGLLVIDAIAKGTPGHAAHQKENQAILNALEDIKWLQNLQLEKISPVLGPTKTTVTQINAGKQHNIVPAECSFVIDVRVNEFYTNEEVFSILNQNMKSELKARSFNLQSSGISKDHPLVKAGKAIGLNTFGSGTLSDQAHLSCPSLKLGPGDTKRSHMANEYIYLEEIQDGINTYNQLLTKLLL